MPLTEKLKIVADEEFEHLPSSPIVEAVIEIRARAEARWVEADVMAAFKSRLPEYPRSESRRESQLEIKLDAGKKPRQEVSDLGWAGLVFKSADNTHVAQFNRDGFAFSRLAPYQDWRQLAGEGLRLWRIHEGIASPSDIQRLGLRYINKLTLPPGDLDFEGYVAPNAMPPIGLELPVLSYFHRDNFLVPGHEYAINVIRAIQPPEGPGMKPGLILDIDVYTTQPVSLDEGTIELRLLEMRWLKNKVFFGSVTEKGLEILR